MDIGARIYNLFPSLVGTTGAWSAHLDRIAAMGFNWVYVNPFHAVGYSGSLYAVNDYFRLNPLFRGDAPDDDAAIRAFVEAANRRGIDVMMDLVVNHTARDAALVHEHPEWYQRNENGEVRSPSANDPAEPSNVTVWTDLAEIDYEERPERAAIVAYFAGVVRHYAALGIRGFRCDAAYKLPAEVWRSLRDAALEIRADAIFAAENLGAPFEAVTALAPAGFDYLFNSSKWWDFRAPWLLEQYDRFRAIAPSIAFPESHDTPRLAEELAGRSDAEIEAEYRLRYLFAAFFSSGVMLPIGYEYGFDRRLDVVMTRPEHWQTPRFDLSPFIASVNALKASLPVLNGEGPQRAFVCGEAIGLVRSGNGTAVALLNPDPARALHIDVPALAAELGGDARDVTPGGTGALLNGAPVELGPLQMRVFVRDERPASGLAAPNAADAREDARVVIIENVWPEIDAGRHAVKRVAGDRFEVSADIFREGHDALAAVLKIREAGASVWREIPMIYGDNDRWHGDVVVETNGKFEYTLEAWPDPFATWHHDTEKKRAAGQVLDLEAIEGRDLVAAARRRASPALQTRFDVLVAAIEAEHDTAARVELMLDESTHELVRRAPDRSRSTASRILPLFVDRLAARYGAWYELFPRSQGAAPGLHGTFADAAKRLPALRELGFDVVYLPPIHPIGHAFRKGKNNSLDPGPDDPGSPWAIGNADGGHMAVEPKLGTLADFDAFVSAARANGMDVALDYALQCSPDHPYVREHSEWFTFRPDGSIKYAENPPKKYQDIVNFNWFGAHAPALWDELRDVVEFWIARGVTIFRVDNPHTKPYAFWEWMIADVQSRRPDVIFLAEAFTRPKVMNELAKVGFSQSYTYFTWRNFKGELTDYCNELAHSAMGEYYRPNFFANTPDILPPFLQSGGRPAFVIRLVLAATLASAYGIYSGYELAENDALPGREEYLDSEKYELKHRDYDALGNLNAEIAAINRIRRENPAFHDWRNVRFLRADHDNVIFYAKSAGDNVVMVAVNLDPVHAADVTIHLPLAELGIAEDRTFACDELLGGDRVQWTGAVQSLSLDPAINPAAILRIDGRFRYDDENAGS